MEQASSSWRTLLVWRFLVKYFQISVVFQLLLWWFSNFLKIFLISKNFGAVKKLFQGLLTSLHLIRLWLSKLSKIDSVNSGNLKQKFSFILVEPKACSEIIWDFDVCTCVFSLPFSGHLFNCLYSLKDSTRLTCNKTFVFMMIQVYW